MENEVVIPPQSEIPDSIRKRIAKLVYTLGEINHILDDVFLPGSLLEFISKADLADADKSSLIPMTGYKTVFLGYSILSETQCRTTEARRCLSGEL